MSRILLLSLVLLTLQAADRVFPPAPPELHSERFGFGIQRTMRLLATSTAARRHPVRILFYGQSITKQEWSQFVAQDLRTRFPFADLAIENRAIGGYSAEYLIRTLPHDVYSFYPDLVIFHDFGGHDNYEKIIAAIRSQTSAEILIQSDYPTWIPTAEEPENEAKAKREAQHEEHSFRWLPALCEKHGCEVVDVRRPWLEYLKKNGLKASAVLADGVHLNAQGNYLLAELTKRHLRYDPALPAIEDSVRTIAAEWSAGHLKLEFEGNRIEAIAARGGPYHQAEATVLIDGRSPSSFPELYAITRPSDTFAVDWPSVNRVTSSVAPIAEDWTLRVLETNADDSQWKFEVTGSRTGTDGVGLSTEIFRSKSGRVVIEPGDYGFHRAFALRHVLTPVGFEVHWRVVPLFNDVYRAPVVADPSREYVTLLASGLANAKHTLELISKGKTDPPVSGIRVFRPVEK